MKRTMKNRVGEAPASASAGACLAAFSSLTDWPVGRPAGAADNVRPATACSIIQKTPTAPAPSNYSGEITSFRRGDVVDAGTARPARPASMGPAPPLAFVCAEPGPAGPRTAPTPAR